MVDIQKRTTMGLAAIPLEEAVLGAIMLDRDAIHTVATIINKETFYLDTHKLIYEAMTWLYSNQYPIELLTVTNQLRAMGRLQIVTPVYIVELTNKVASAANIEYHCRVLVQHQIKRELRRIGYDMYTKGEDASISPDDLLQETQAAIFAILDGSTSDNLKNASQAITEELARQERILSLKDGLIGVPTGIQTFDNAIGGLQEPDLWIIAARPGMGKTALILSMIINQVKERVPAAIFSLEMSVNQLTQRIVAMESQVPTTVIRDPRKRTPQEQEQIFSAIETISDCPLYMDDTPGISIMELSAKCRKLKRDKDIQVIYVDYLQLMSGESKSKQGNREQEISFISRSLKGLAKELKTPIIALSQLSRDVEKRGGSKRPQLSDLRESGSLEQDADNIAFIYRAEYYKVYEDADGESLRGVAEIIIEKYRNGEPQTLYLNFVSHLTQFRDFPDLDEVFNGPQTLAKAQDEELPF